MNVIFDISVLGVGHRNPRSRTGVYRTVYGLAVALSQNDRCRLILYPGAYPWSIIDCQKSIQSNPSLREVPIIGKRLEFESLIDGLITKDLDISRQSNKESELRTNSVLRVLSKRVQRKLLITSRDIISPVLGRIDQIQFGNAQIFHSPFYPIADLIKRTHHLKSFLTIYDLVPVLFPKFFDEGRIQFFRNLLDSIKPNDWILCISHSTKSDLCNYLKIEESMVTVTPLAADPELFYPCTDLEKIKNIKLKYKIPDGDYILSVNTLEPRKNIDHTIRSFYSLIESQNIEDLSLVLVGNNGWSYEKIYKELSTKEELRKRVIITDYIPDEELAALYSGAMAFIYPSLYEGFGLPVLEAMQSGSPVIVSNNSSFPELVGDAGILLDPKDSDSLCQAILKIYSNDDYRKMYANKSLARAKLFSWEKCGNEVINAYENAYSRSQF